MNTAHRVSDKVSLKVSEIIGRYAHSHTAGALLLEAWDRALASDLPLGEAINEEFTEPLASRIRKVVGGN